MTHRFKTAALAALCLIAAGAVLLAIDPSAAFAMPALGSGHLPTDLGGFLLGGFTVAELMQKRSGLLKELEELAKQPVTDEIRSKFDAKETELRTLDADIQRAQRLEEARRSAAASAAPQGDQGNGSGAGSEQRPGIDPIEQRAAQHPLPATAAPQRDLRHEAGAFIRSFAQAQVVMRESGAVTSPARIAHELYGERHYVTDALQRSQVQAASSGPGGGFTIAPTYANEIVRGFGPRAIVRPLARVVPGNAIYLKGKDRVLFDYVGENEQPKLTKVSFGFLTIGERTFGGILPISKNLLRNTSYGVEAYCVSELEIGGARFEDNTYLFGDGVGKRPKGLAYAVPDANRFVAVNKTDPTHVEVRKDLRKILAALANADVPVDQNGPAWLMHPVVKMYLEDLYVGDVKAFPTLEGENPTLLGYPVKTTTQIPGPGSASGSTIFFGAFAFAMIGESVSMTLSTSDQATVKDGSGNIINFWAQDMLGVRLGMSHDFALQHEVAFGLLSAVKWGAA